MESSLKRKTITIAAVGKLEITELSAKGHIALAEARTSATQSDLFAVTALHSVIGWEDETVEAILAAHSLATLTELSTAIFALSGLDEPEKKA